MSKKFGFTLISLLLTKARRSCQGFTLIELLVVVTIITALISIAIPSYNKFVAKGRDTKRQASLKVFQSSLEQYHADQNFYPTSIDISQPFTSNTGNPIQSASPKVYLGKIITDPLSNNPLYSPMIYEGKPAGCNNSSTFCISYCIYYSLEDSGLANSSSTSCPDKSSDPGKTAYNYELTPP